MSPATPYAITVTHQLTAPPTFGEMLRAEAIAFDTYLRAALGDPVRRAYATATWSVASIIVLPLAAVTAGLMGFLTALGVSIVGLQWLLSP